MDHERQDSELRKESTVHSLEDALALTGLGKFHHFLLFTCGLCLMSVIVETLNIGFIIPLIDFECNLKLSLTEKGILNSAAFAGIVVSSFLWGFMADTKGRHRIMLICSPISLTFSILSSFSIHTWMLIVTRFLVGFFISGLAANTYAYLGEFHCEKNRGKYLNLCGVFMAFGLTFCPALGYIIMKFDHITTFAIKIPFIGINYSIWRIFLILCSTILFLITLSLCYLPESPKYLIVRRNQREKALEILKRIHKLNTRHTLFPVSQIDAASENLLFTSQNDKKSFFTTLWAQTSPLLKKPLFANSWRISYLMFSLFAVSSGLFLWIPEILNQILEHPDYSVCEVIEKIIDSKNSTTLTAACDHVNVNENIYKITFFMGAFFSVVYFINGLVINKCGKINLNAFWFFVCGLSGILIPFFRNYYMILLLLVILLTCGVCGSISSSIIVELFPTNVRAISLCIILMIGRIGAVIGSLFVSLTIINACNFMFIIFGIILFIAAIVSLTLPKC